MLNEDQLKKVLVDRYADLLEEMAAHERCVSRNEGEAGFAEYAAGQVKYFQGRSFELVTTANLMFGHQFALELHDLAQAKNEKDRKFWEGVKYMATHDMDGNPKGA